MKTKILACILMQSTLLTAALPEPLLHHGAPIHPEIVIATQWGDSSRFDPKTIDDITSDTPSSYNPQTNWVTCSRDYVVDYGSDKRTFTDFTAYRYIGSYKDRHVIHGDFYDTAGTGRFATLGLVKRVDNTLLCAGEITAGDRGWGGIISVTEFKGHILHYAQTTQLDGVLNTFCDTDLGLAFPPPFISGVSILYEVDLNDESLQSKPIGLRFDWETDDYNSDFVDRPVTHFFEVAHTYCKQGKKKLTLQEAKVFAQTIINCVNGTDP